MRDVSALLDSLLARAGSGGDGIINGLHART
jgi:hypothetical protein